MDLTQRTSPEALLEHHAWMRALARRLVRQAGRADDVVQDVWVRALERPPDSAPRAGSLRAWLGGVVRNVARQEQRASARRTAHERDAAGERPPDEPRSAADAVERLATHQDVVEAVLALKEPFKSAIVMRFYEGLPPRRIAQGEGVSVATVKSRIARGLERLREKLQAEYGRTWSLALAPLLVRPEKLVTGSIAAAPAKLALLVAPLVVAVAWVATRDGERFGQDGQLAAVGSSASDTVAAASFQSTRTDASRLESAFESSAERQEVVEEPGRLEGSEVVGERTGAARAGGEISAPVYALDLILTLPDGKAVEPAMVRASLRDERRGRHRVEGRDVDRLRFAGLALGTYELEVTARRFRHLAEELALTDANDMDKGREAFVHRATLWPSDWIPVIVRTRDGKSFASLAREAGYEPKRFFVDAFYVHASHDPLSRELMGGPPPPTDENVGVFRPPPKYQQVELGRSVAGSLELLAPRPLWVGLWIHGVFFESRLLRANEAQLVFEIEPNDLEARFATVSLRLVDRRTGRPVDEAQATLKANTSAHRRHDLQSVSPGRDGRLVFQRVMPGRHELTVHRDGHVVQRRLVLSPGEELELGDIEIGSGPGIDLVVVDAQGRPVKAWLELAPYEPGRTTRELYHPNLHRSTDDRGRYQLPIPDSVSILRARPLDHYTSGRRGQTRQRYGGTPEVETANILIDPEKPPRELRVVARERVEVRFAPITPWSDDHHLTVVDELGLIVERVAGRTAEGLKTELVAGAYRVVRWNGEEELGAVDVVIERSRPEVLAP